MSWFGNSVGESVYQDNRDKQKEADAFTKNINDIADFMKKSNRFEAVEETHGRHFRLMKGGKHITTVYFKWAFGGWSIIHEGERKPIDSIETLKKYL